MEDSDYMFYISEDYLNHKKSEIIAIEGFLRRASKYDLPFVLKGSYITRQYMPISEMKKRLPGDIDWLYLSKNKLSAEEANEIFTNWAIDITETELDDGIKFKTFKGNNFQDGMGLDYAMNDDFPTTRSYINYYVGNQMGVAMIEISFNLDVDMEPMPLLYKPVVGEPFTIPYTPPLSFQIAWKLHQTIVRPRFKDLYDLSYLLQHSSYDSKAVNETLQALVNECYVDKIDNSRILNIFSKEGLESIYHNYIKTDDDYSDYHHKFFVGYDLYDYYFKKYIGDVNISATKERWYKFAEQFYTLLNNVGINEKISLPKPTKKEKTK